MATGVRNAQVQNACNVTTSIIFSEERFGNTRLQRSLPFAKYAMKSSTQKLKVANWCAKQLRKSANGIIASSRKS